MAVEITEERVREALRGIQDPDLGQDIVSLGFVKNVKICGGDISFDLELTTPACPVKELFRTQCEDALKGMDGVESVSVRLSSQVRGRPEAEHMVLPRVRNVVAVASGKGGVGKSTVSVNLALALRAEGAEVGVLDADIYGPSIPLMMGIDDHPDVLPDRRIGTLEAHGIQLMSMGFLLEDDGPVIWRGPMVTKLIQQFLGGVDWGELDYLLIDLPPGTGDAQLTLTQSAPLSGSIIVTTPQDVSLIDARKGLRMFERVNVPVLGIVENMSVFVCPHCGEGTEIFRRGGGERTAQELRVPYLGDIPIDPAVVRGGDEGSPVVVRDPDSPASRGFRKVAGQVAAQLSIVHSRQRGLPADFRLEWK